MQPYKMYLRLFCVLSCIFIEMGPHVYGQRFRRKHRRKTAFRIQARFGDCSVKTKPGSHSKPISPSKAVPQAHFHHTLNTQSEYGTLEIHMNGSGSLPIFFHRVWLVCNLCMTSSNGRADRNSMMTLWALVLAKCNMPSSTGHVSLLGYIVTHLSPQGLCATYLWSKYGNYQTKPYYYHDINISVTLFLPFSSNDWANSYILLWDETVTSETATCSTCHVYLLVPRHPDVMQAHTQTVSWRSQVSGHMYYKHMQIMLWA